MSTVNAVATFFESVFSDSVTVNISVGYGEVAGQTVASLGASLTYLNNYTYTQIRNAFVGDTSTADDTSAVNSLPASL